MAGYMSGAGTGKDDLPAAMNGGPFLGCTSTKTLPTLGSMLGPLISRKLPSEDKGTLNMLQRTLGYT